MTRSKSFWGRESGLTVVVMWTGWCLLLAGCGRIQVPAASTLPQTPVIATGALRQPSKMVAGIRFENVAQPAGIHFLWPRQARPLRNLEAFGCGCAFLDYDNDGWQDILLVAKPRVALYHNLRNGRFEDVTETAGISAIQGDWKGCAIGDYDGDGFLDLVLTGYRRLALLKNIGGQRFTDVTVQAGLSPVNRNHWGSSAGFMDLAGHGRLDLVILNYVIFNEHEKQVCEDTPGIVTGCAPSYYRPEFGELWENVGSGRFRDVTAASGFKKTNGKALVVAFADAYGDGRMSLFVGNDGTPADFLRNLGRMRFQNVGVQSGLSHGVQDHLMAAMGADWADYDRDGRMDLTVTDFSNEPYSLFRAIGPGLYEEACESTGLSGPTLKPLGFGAKWLDMDNDGWPDIVFTNGHVYDRTNDVDPSTTFREPLMLFHNEHGKQFTDLTPKMGGELAQDLLGRGLATGDFDNDGRIDFLVVDYEGEPLLFHNVSQTPHHWITLDIRGSGFNRFAYGAQVTARAGKEIWVGQVSPASSYLSSSDPRVHFGLGDITTLDTVSIRWSDGRRKVLRNVAADQILRVEEGEGGPSTHGPLRGGDAGAR